MASQSNADMWMGAASSEISMLSNLEESGSWKTPASSNNMDSKDGGGGTVGAGGSFISKGGLLEEEWYVTPESSVLMELSAYPGLATSCPLYMGGTGGGIGGAVGDVGRSSFGSLLDSSTTTMSFDTSSNGGGLVAGFRSTVAPSSMCAVDDLSPHANTAAGGLFSGISQGGQQLSRNVPMDSFSSEGLPSTNFHNQAMVSGNMQRTNFPIYDPYTALRQQGNNNDKDHGGTGDLVPYDHTNNKRAGINNNNNNNNNNNGFMQGQQQTSMTLFQKRAANSRRSAGTGTPSPASKSPPRVTTSASNDSSMDKNGSPHLQNNKSNNGDDHNNNDMGLDMADDYDVKDDDDLDESGDGSGGPYEVEEGSAAAGAGAGAAADQLGALVGGAGKGGKGGKRGLPAKNLMAERRRRKKLNDRLYMLRSVVPKITKMDRASILGDAIEYLKELLQRISDIHNELEAAKMEQSRSLPSSPGGRAAHQAGYTAAAAAAAMVKEECPVLPNPENQPPRVEVRQRDQALNVHMFCARRPGILLSTVRALDALGLDVQQAVISCFNGFALDLFRAEAKDVDVGPDEIKAVLLLTAGCGGHSLQ